MSDRHLIVVDTETTGLDINKHVVLEIAAIDTVTGEEFHFVPYVTRASLSGADPIALATNRYYERKVFEQELTREDTLEHAHKLIEMLQGNTLGGPNPTFDAAMLTKFFGTFVGSEVATPWHHRLADLAAYAAGALGLAPADLPGLHRVLEELDIINEDEHSALGDARATAAAFAALQDRAHSRTALPTISMWA